MDIIIRRPEELVPYEKNPRHNDSAVPYVSESIEQFGFLIPILIDRNNVIIAGDTRRKAALKLGMPEVPCIIADDLTPEQVKAFRLVDNKTAEYSTWDFEKLADELAEIAEIDLSCFKFPDISEDILNVNDGDFLKDTEIVKERTPKTATCPKCGEVFAL